jgi:hypothetical protein
MSSIPPAQGDEGMSASSSGDVFPPVATSSPAVPYPPAVAEPRVGETLRGDAVPLGKGPFAVVEALLKAPARVLHDVQHGRGALFKLTALVLVTMIVTGLVMASFSGGLQLLAVPVKLGLGVFFCALICLPSLYIFSSLAGAEQSLKETWGALLMGVALIGVLLVGLAPVSWVFSQATTSPIFMGVLHVVFLLIASWFGLGLVHRALAAANGRPIKGSVLWSLLFLLVVLQMTTTLRPIVGEYDGAIFHEKQFFLAHWIEEIT